MSDSERSDWELLVKRYQYLLIYIAIVCTATLVVALVAP